MRKYNQIILTVLFLLLSFRANAVFEGRNEDLKQYQSIRNQVELNPMGQGKAYSNSSPEDGYDDNGNPLGPSTGSGLPLSDFPLLFLLLGGVSYGVYSFRRKENGNALKRL